MEVFTNAGVMALASMLVGVLPLGLGIVYAIWPTEHRLMLMRPLSLATICATVAGTALGLINELRYISRMQAMTFSGAVAHGFAESLATLFVGFGCLTVAWLCVTLGLWRRP